MVIAMKPRKLVEIEAAADFERASIRTTRGLPRLRRVSPNLRRTYPKRKSRCQTTMSASKLPRILAVLANKQSIVIVGLVSLTAHLLAVVLLSIATA
jgi:hypothetical protein